MLVGVCVARVEIDHVAVHVVVVVVVACVVDAGCDGAGFVVAHVQLRRWI